MILGDNYASLGHKVASERRHCLNYVQVTYKTEIGNYRVYLGGGGGGGGVLSLSSMSLQMWNEHSCNSHLRQNCST